jgi:uncharacterized membrane protein
MTWWRTPVRRLLSEEDEAKVMEAIRAAEARTSGEIRVHVEHRASGDALSAARSWFHRLGMDKTEAHNGILFYFAVDQHAFAIVGDSGIHARVGDAFWQALRDLMTEAFAEGSPATGLSRAIEEAGSRLAEHFPRGKDDKNELSDEIS